MEGVAGLEESNLAGLARLISAEVAGLQDAWTLSDVQDVTEPDYEMYLLTLSALSHVHSTLSPGRYWTLHRDDRVPSTTEECIAARAGICGNQAQAMLDVMRELGGQARPIGLYYEGSLGQASHAAVEVAWGERWHFIDVTNGAVFRRRGGRAQDLLSLREVLEAPDRRQLALLNASKPEFQLTSDLVGDPLEYLEAEPDVVFDGQGTVHLKPRAKGARLHYSLIELPNYVGAIPRFMGGVGTLTLRLEVPQPIERLDITVQNVGCAEPRLRAVSDSGSWEAEVSPGADLSLPVRAGAGHVLLSAPAAPGEVCYVVMSAISAVTSAGELP
jgi:hypothetical protein